MTACLNALQGRTCRQKITIASSATRTQSSPGYHTQVLGGCTRGATREETYHSLPKYKERLYSILMYKRSFHRMRLVPYSSQDNKPTPSVYIFSQIFSTTGRVQLSSDTSMEIYRDTSKATIFVVYAPPQRRRKWARTIIEGGALSRIRYYTHIT